ncbi:hypothetical protein ALC60_10550 [Trachymyrmex zeteki]|uniref:Uncharacterized protein n=1 Tax=Mycetomoellerius zeteki TaxID=64791 RepID=A0A151WRA1_9HYME|nr:hypothetical protein ALC60_10550 [Trachymyrmex zeteki]
MATSLTLAMLNDDEQQLFTQKLAQRRWISKSTQTRRPFNSRESTGSRISLNPTRTQGNVSGFIYDSALMQAAILPLWSEISPLP